MRWKRNWLDEAARSILEAAQSARRASDFLLLERLARQLIQMGDDSNRDDLRADGYYNLGLTLSNLNRTAEATAATRAAIELFERLGNRLAAARTTMNLGVIALDNAGDVAAARQLFDESLHTIRELGEPVNVAIALGNISEVCRLEGDYRGALRTAEEALAILREIGDTQNVAWILEDIAHFQLLLRRPADAIATMAEAYAELGRTPDPRWLAWYFDVWFLIAAQLGNLEVAAQLLAFNDKYRDEFNQPRSQAMLPWFSEPRERLSRQLGGARIDELVESGETLTVESAQCLVVASLSSLA